MNFKRGFLNSTRLSMSSESAISLPKELTDNDDYLALNYSVKYDSLPPPGKMPAFVLTSQPPLELLPPGEVQTECMISPFVRQKLLAVPRYQRLLKPLPPNSEPLLRMSTSGKGVYATRAIEAMSLIIDERPFMLTPVCPPRVPIVFKKANMIKEEEERIVLLENEKTLRNVLERMPEWRQEAFLKLPNDYSEVEGCGPISGILRTNRFMIGAEVFMDDSEDTSDVTRRYAATFDVVSRLNYSSMSNAAYAWWDASMSMKVVATRAIESGEEITIEYTKSPKMAISRSK